MSFKVAIGSFWHETSSFSNDLTPLQLFRSWIFDEAPVMVEKQRGKTTVSGTVGGYVDYAEEKGWDIVPLIAAGALPNGPVTEEAYLYIKNAMLEGLDGQNDLDGVLLHLHGAAVTNAKGVFDCEGDLLTAVRDKVGDDVPILVMYDQHGNISDLMVEKANASFGYNTQPHKDGYELEQEIASVFEGMMEGKYKPTQYRAQPPLLLPAIRTETSEGPMKKMMDKAYEWEEREDVINVSPFAGFYGSDKYEAGPSIVVTTNDNPELAKEIAEEMATYMWEIKDEFLGDIIPMEEAIRIAKTEGGLWAFIDECDDPCGAGPADGTYILQKCLEAGIPSGGVSSIHDPAVIERAFAAGEGATIGGTLGAWKDGLHGEPIELNAKVVRLTTDPLPFAYYGGDPQDVGRVALIDQGGFLILVTELKADTENIDVFGWLGIDVADLNVIILKGLGHAYKEVFKDKPKGYLTPDSIGITHPDVRKIGDFKLIRRPCHPFDENVELRFK